jgi:predicted O-methyltransferase YrrM
MVSCIIKTLYDRKSNKLKKIRKRLIMVIRDLFKKATEKYAHETGELCFLPDNRYNEKIFLTQGQYDWLSGQLLYCLIRYLKPQRIMEVSTCSGYSTMFMALALKKNEGGIIFSYELDPKAAKSAATNFNNYQVNDFVKLHIGDVQKTSVLAPQDFDLYFLDCLHTYTFARWFIENHVLKASRRDALFHMHDILPRHARVRCFNGPPFEGTSLDPNPKISRSKKLKRAIKNILHIEEQREDDRAPFRIYPPPSEKELPTYDGNCTTEADLGNDLAAFMKEEDSVFLYDVIDDYPNLEPPKYNSMVYGRADHKNMPMEWNNSWWCSVAALKEAYKALNSRR